MSAIPFNSFYLECDGDGCDETFALDAGDLTADQVRRKASKHEWDVVGDRDYCGGCLPPTNNERLAALAEAIAEDMEQAAWEFRNKNKGGQQVGPRDGLRVALPSQLRHFEWYARALRAALVDLLQSYLHEPEHQTPPASDTSGTEKS